MNGGDLLVGEITTVLYNRYKNKVDKYALSAAESPNTVASLQR